jgi:hypothetical protein
VTRKLRKKGSPASAARSASPEHAPRIPSPSDDEAIHKDEVLGTASDEGEQGAEPGDGEVSVLVCSRAASRAAKSPRFT